MSTKSNLLKSSVIAVSMLAANSAWADADISVQPVGTAAEATANVDICVVIPEILIFGVGPVGDTVSKIKWTVGSADGYTDGNNQTYTDGLPAFTAPAPFGTTPVADITDGGAGSSAAGAVATLPVFLFSNDGTDVTISSTVSGGNGGGGTADVLQSTAGDTIPISDFTSGGASILHPAFESGGTQTADTPATAGVVNLNDTWTYEYSPTAIPVAGTYEARITYVAAQP